jgi:hypothetical protein
MMLDQKNIMRNPQKVQIDIDSPKDYQFTGGDQSRISKMGRSTEKFSRGD